MPYYPKTLEKMVWATEEIEYSLALRLLLHVAKALRYLHKLSLTHKNVKPGMYIYLLLQEGRGRETTNVRI